MNALDTNVLVRFLVNDDKKQAAIIRKKIMQCEDQKETLFVSTLVVLELIWVLESVYRVDRRSIIQSINAVISMPVLEFEHQDTLRRFIETARHSQYDLSDILIAQTAASSGCNTTYTFDKKASKFSLFELLS